MKCGACGRTGLQSTQLALVLSASSYERRRVCGRCIGNALVIVAEAPTAPHPLAIPETERETREVLRALAKHFEGLRAAYDTQERDDYLCGRVDTLESAARTCRDWAERPNIRGAS